MPRSTQKQINRENILKQGVALFTEKGYHGTGLQEILNAVQIPKGSFYNYFGSKENYAAEAVQYYIEPFIVQLTECLQSNEGNALLALENYFKVLIADLENADFKGGCLLGNLMGEIGDTSDLCQKSLQHAIHRYRSLIQTCLEQAQQQGTVRGDKTARAMADLLVNHWQGALLRMKVEQSIDPLTQCCSELLGDFFKA
jgi:TetR/AcrR family transcriptional repressor of nem operon